MAENDRQQTAQNEQGGQPSAGPAAEIMNRLREVLNNVRERIGAMPSQQRRWLLISSLLVLGVAVGMLWLAMRPDWRILYAGLDAQDAQQLGTELTQAGINYDLTPDGASIRVPVSELNKARLLVAAKGIPQTGRMGFEIFDKPNWVGSEFDEKVNYQRALEGELEHTIETLGAVRSARVHLVMPEQSLFTSEQRDAKASVVLKLRKASLTQEEIGSIRNLVAGAVDNLRPDDVVLVDADGRQSFAPPSATAEAAAEEQALQGKIVELLTPLAGRDNIRATVNISYDEGTDEQTDEVYDPANMATLSMRRSEQTSSPQVRPMGVPGTASNTPAAAALGSAQNAVQSGTNMNRNPVPPLMQAAPQAAAKNGPSQTVTTSNPNLPLYPEITGQGQNSREESANYAVSQRTHHSVEGPGRVRRITAAILINDRSVIEGSGKQTRMVWRARTPDEMSKLEQLAQAAVGYDPRRGDAVVLENVSFSSNEGGKATTLEKVLGQAAGFAALQPGLVRTLLLMAALMILLLWIVRPAMKQITTALKQPALLAAPRSGQQDVAALASGAAGLSTEVFMRTDAAALPGQSMAPRNAQTIFDHVTDYIKREPLQSKRLLESWMQAPEETN